MIQIPLFARTSTSSATSPTRRRHSDRNRRSSARADNTSSGRQRLAPQRQQPDEAAAPTRRTPPASLAAQRGLIHLRMRAATNDECVICTQTFDVDDVVTCLPCGHMHHSKCILGWLKRKCTCPTCRYELPSADEEEVPTIDRIDSPPPRKSTQLKLYNPVLGTASGIPNSNNDAEDENMEGMLVCLADF